MFSIMAFVYVCITFFLTGENYAGYMLPAMALDAVLFYFLCRE